MVVVVAANRMNIDAEPVKTTKQVDDRPATSQKSVRISLGVACQHRLPRVQAVERLACVRDERDGEPASVGEAKRLRVERWLVRTHERRVQIGGTHPEQRDLVEIATDGIADERRRLCVPEIVKRTHGPIEDPFGLTVRPKSDALEVAIDFLNGEVPSVALMRHSALDQA